MHVTNSCYSGLDPAVGPFSCKEHVFCSPTVLSAVGMCMLWSRRQPGPMHSCRGSVRLYSDFYESDIIVASPLALATKLSEDEEEGELQWHLYYACPGLVFRHCPTVYKLPQRVTVTVLFVSNSVGPLLPKCWVSTVCWYTGLGVCLYSFATSFSLLCCRLYEASLWHGESYACMPCAIM